MKRFLTAGERCGIRIRNNSKIVLILINSISLIVLFLFLSPNLTFSQEIPKIKKPLSVGDKIPEEIWNFELIVANHDEGFKTIKLKEFKGKLIVLDFWTQYCAPCILSLQYAETVKAKYPEKFNIFGISDLEDSSLLRNLVKSNNILSKISFDLIANSKELKSFFPFISVPHIVWISAEGIFLGATGAADLNIENINNILNSNYKFISPKPIFFKIIGVPLLSIDSKKFGLNDEIQYLNTSITQHLKGYPSAWTNWTDSLNLISHHQILNWDLTRLVNVAYSEFIFQTNNEIIYPYTTAWRKPHETDILEYEKWSQSNTFCISISLPSNWNKQQQQDYIKSEIRRLLKVWGIYVKVKELETNKEIRIIDSIKGYEIFKKF